MSRISLMQLRSILLQNVTMMIFVVINFNATLPSVFWGGGGGGGWTGKAPMHNTNANGEVLLNPNYLKIFSDAERFFALSFCN